MSYFYGIMISYVCCTTECLLKVSLLSYGHKNDSTKMPHGVDTFYEYLIVGADNSQKTIMRYFPKCFDKIVKTIK